MRTDDATKGMSHQSHQVACATALKSFDEALETVIASVIVGCGECDLGHFCNMQC